LNDEWATPQDLFDKLNKEFGFYTDLCANKDNNKCDLYTTDVEKYVSDSVTANTTGISHTYWMNPPYSRGNIDMCMEQAYKLSTRGHTVVCLVRCDPSTQWFQKHVDGVAAEVRMLDSRVRFVGASSAYNFPCCVVVYRQTSDCKIVLYKKITQLVSADDIQHAGTMADKVIQRMCSGDSEFEEASGMLHSIRRQDVKIEASPDQGIQRDFVEETAGDMPTVPDDIIA